MSWPPARPKRPLPRSYRKRRRHRARRSRRLCLVPCWSRRRTSWWSRRRSHYRCCPRCLRRLRRRCLHRRPLPRYLQHLRHPRPSPRRLPRSQCRPRQQSPSHRQRPHHYQHWHQPFPSFLPNPAHCRPSQFPLPRRCCSQPRPTWTTPQVRAPSSRISLDRLPQRLRRRRRHSTAPPIQWVDARCAISRHEQATSARTGSFCATFRRADRSRRRWRAAPVGALAVGWVARTPSRSYQPPAPERSPARRLQLGELRLQAGRAAGLHQDTLQLAREIRPGDA